MQSGYVLDFSNNSFQRFVKGIIGIDIYEDEGYEEYCSKANKLRQIFEIESLSKVTKLINALLNYYEDISLGFVNEDDIKQLRKKVQCFRHSTEESLQERKEFRKSQKQFLIEFGMAISNLIYNELKNY